MQRIIRREQLAVRYAGPFGGASQAWDGSDVVVLLAGGIAVRLSPFQHVPCTEHLAIFCCSS